MHPVYLEDPIKELAAAGLEVRVFENDRIYF